MLIGLGLTPIDGPQRAWVPSLDINFTTAAAIPSFLTCVSPDLSSDGLAVANADQAATGTLTWFNATEGTILLEGQTAVSDATFRRAISISDTTANNEINISIASGNVRGFVTAGGVTQASWNFGAWGASARKIALAYKTNDFAACTNGGAVTADASGTIPTVSRLAIGALGTSPTSAFFTGDIRRVAYWPRRLPNAALQAISA